MITNIQNIFSNNNISLMLTNCQNKLLLFKYELQVTLYNFIQVVKVKFNF